MSDLNAPARLVHLVYEFFKEHFSGTPLMIKSPGRVNLIGEHTDYNEGFVLPGAIDKAMVFAMAANNSSTLNLHSIDMEETYSVELTDILDKSGKGWPDYILGVIQAIRERGPEPGGVNIAFGSNIPIGAGLSSSAALECGIVFGLNTLFDLGLDKKEMAYLGKKAENNFVGVQSGIMDQFAILHGEEGKLIKLDCRSLEYDLIPFIRSDIKVILCDSKIRRDLVTSEYNVRKQQCEQGVAFLQSRFDDVSSLRDVTIEMLREYIGSMDPVLYKRCCYVISENERVLNSCEDLDEGDYDSFGQRMWESHRGLRNDYEVSCRELDMLVDAAMALEGVYGSRMMGGGFGGCTINLVKTEEIDSFKQTIRDEYRKKTSKEPEFYITNISSGAHII